MLLSGETESGRSREAPSLARSSIAIRRNEKMEREEIRLRKNSQGIEKKLTDDASLALDHAPNALDGSLHVAIRESASKRSASESSNSRETRQRPESARENRLLRSSHHDAPLCRRCRVNLFLGSGGRPPRQKQARLHPPPDRPGRPGRPGRSILRRRVEGEQGEEGREPVVVALARHALSPAYRLDRSRRLAGRDPAAVQGREAHGRADAVGDPQAGGRGGLFQGGASVDPLGRR